jgi:hypothetical protein
VSPSAVAYSRMISSLFGMTALANVILLVVSVPSDGRRRRPQASRGRGGYVGGRLSPRIALVTALLPVS